MEENINKAIPVQYQKSLDLQYLARRATEYGMAFLFALIVFTVFSAYIYLRRGFYDLYIINKIFAGVAATQLGIVLLLGPFSRMFKAFDRYLRLRNEFGIMVFLLALIHSIISLFFLENHFPFAKYFVPINIPFIFGLIGILLLSFLFLISNKAARDLLTVKRWWPIQFWGARVAFIATALHVYIMKYPGWVEWYTKGGNRELKHPEWPGLGLLIGWLILFVLIVRLTEAVDVKLGRIATYVSFFLLTFIYVFTFIWGQQFSY